MPAFTTITILFRKWLYRHPATYGNGAWLHIRQPPSLEALGEERTKAVLSEASQKLTEFILSDEHQMGDELPRKSMGKHHQNS